MPINPLTGLEDDQLATPKPQPAAPFESLPIPVATPVPEPMTPAPVAPAPMPEPIAPEAQPAPMTPQAPQFKPVETSESVTTTRSTSMTPEEKRLQAERDALVQQQVATAAKTAEIAKEQANIEVQKQDQIAQMAAKREEAIGQLMAKADEEIAQKTAEQEAQYEAFKKAEFKDYWSDKSTGSKIIAAIAVGLGQLGQGMQGKDGNPALDIINKQIEQDFAKQRANIGKLKDQFEMSKDGVAQAGSNYARSLQNLQLKEAAAYESTAAKYAALLASKGIPAAQIQADANVQALQAQALDKKLQVEKELRNETTTQVKKKVDMMQVDANGNPVMPEKPLTEGQGKSVNYGRRMMEGIKNYDKAGGLSPEGADAVRKSIKSAAYYDANKGLYLIGAGAWNVPNLSEKDRLALQAIREVTTAGLRKDSGAAIGLQEFESEFDQFVPRVGDTPAVIRQKRGTMTTRLAGLQEEAGIARNRIEIPEEPKAAPSGNQPKLGEVIDGYRYMGKDPTDPKNWEKTK